MNKEHYMSNLDLRIALSNNPMAQILVFSNDTTLDVIEQVDYYSKGYYVKGEFFADTKHLTDYIRRALLEEPMTDKKIVETYKELISLFLEHFKYNSIQECNEKDLDLLVSDIVVAIGRDNSQREFIVINGYSQTMRDNFNNL